MLKLRALNVYTKIKAALAIKLAEGMRESGSLHFETAPPRAATTTRDSLTSSRRCHEKKRYREPFLSDSLNRLANDRSRVELSREQIIF